MLNYTTYAEDTGLLEKLSLSAIFESLVAVTSILIIVANSLIVKIFMRKPTEQEQIPCL